MEFAAWIYFFTVVSNIAGVIFAVWILLLIALVAVSVIGFIAKWESISKDPPPEYWALNKNLAKWVAIVSIPVVFFPHSDDVNKILAAYAAQSVYEMEQVQGVGSKSLKAMNKLLDEYISED